MENLLAREENGQPWSLQNDRDLLKALQDLSGDIMGRMQNLEADLADLDLETISTAARGGNAAASFNSLCHSQYIEQEVAPFSGGDKSKPSSSQITLTPENFREVVHPKYRQALQLASRAFGEADQGSREPVPLPLIFGSPEYLQDAKFGIGSTSSQEVAHLPIEETQAVEGPGDVELSIPDAAVDDDDVSEEVPDFRSMLEAALRGDLDGGLGQDFQVSLGDPGGADQESLFAKPEIPEFNVGRDTPPLKQIPSNATPATPDGARQDSGGGQGLGEPQESDAEAGRGVRAWGGPGSQVSGRLEGEPLEATVLEEHHSIDSNSDKYGSPKERSSSLNLQELLQGHGDLFSEEELMS